MDRLASPVLEFAIDVRGKRVLFCGGLVLEGANFRLVDTLLANFRSAKAGNSEVPFLPATTLAERLEVDEQSMRQLVRRLRRAIEPLAVDLGIPIDQDTLIETRERAGYRLNPNVREIAVADIKSDQPPPTRD